MITTFLSASLRKKTKGGINSVGSDRQDNKRITISFRQNSEFEKMRS